MKESQAFSSLGPWMVNLASSISHFFLPPVRWGRLARAGCSLVFPVLQLEVWRQLGLGISLPPGQLGCDKTQRDR